jgi:dTDP-4-dehydrorhamnose reductase
MVPIRLDRHRETHVIARCAWVFGHSGPRTGS